MPATEACAVAIVDDSSLSATGKLAAALDRADLWNVLRRIQAGRPPDQVSIVIKPEFAGFAVGSPTVTDPALVEHLIDLLHDRGFTNTVVVGTADSSALWAENRDLYALSDLLGYRYTTPTGRSYDIVDLAGTLDETVFPIESVLRGLRHLTRVARCGRADRIQQEPHRRSVRIRIVPRHADRRSAADRQGPALSETPASW